MSNASSLWKVCRKEIEGSWFKNGEDGMGCWWSERYWSGLIYWASSSASVRVALRLDIAKMYLQVGLHERDHDVCRFLWRRDEVGSSPSMYRFTWVFWFGLPSLLGHERCKISPGSTSGPFPTMLDKMKFKIYVENLVVSCESLPIARMDILRLSAHVFPQFFSLAIH
ncbi:hypothetical protein T06_5387 [Trichinella sp. T6]|nr:hypothetical protein T06_5387 [Trichinella sp. T6]